MFKIQFLFKISKKTRCWPIVRVKFRFLAKCLTKMILFLTKTSNLKFSINNFDFSQKLPAKVDFLVMEYFPGAYETDFFAEFIMYQ